MLTRVWAPGPRFCVFIGLNPSTADERVDDPTVRRCILYARAWGFDAMRMLNIFAFRATDPADMKAEPDPVGEGNDEALFQYTRDASMVVACWGAHGTYLGRGVKVRRMLEPTVELHALALTKSGHPGHPLYLRADLKPFSLGGQIGLFDGKS